MILMAITSFQTIELSVLVTLSIPYLLSVCSNFPTLVSEKKKRGAFAIRICVAHTKVLTFEKCFSQMNSGHKTHKGYLS